MFIPQKPLPVIESQVRQQEKFAAKRTRDEYSKRKRDAYREQVAQEKKEWAAEHHEKIDAMNQQVLTRQQPSAS
jgi:hypothetical protein